MPKRIIQKLFNAMGYQIVRISSETPPDMDVEFIPIYERCKDYTMTSIERCYALYKSTQYILQHKILGDIVECGVWKGGSSMICALTMIKTGEIWRKIYMYDTYSGMSEPTIKDVDYKGGMAWRKLKKVNLSEWTFAPIEEVQKNMFSTGYPRESLLFIKGKVEDTIPATIPESISLLRLDTDWYESTYHELCHLFPRLSPSGVIILDDYGHWKGAKEAADKYFQENAIKILFNRIDYTGRIGIKV